jgi:hypothetical protein
LNLKNKKLTVGYAEEHLLVGPWCYLLGHAWGLWCEIHILQRSSNLHIISSIGTMMIKSINFSFKTFEILAFKLIYQYFCISISVSVLLGNLIKLFGILKNTRHSYNLVDNLASVNSGTHAIF